MAFSLNKVTLIGNVGKDPEIRSTQDGREIASFPIATSDVWKDKNSGEKKERTEWHKVVVFHQHFISIIKNYLHKGSKVYVEGALQTRKWQDQAGVERQTTEIVIQSFNGTVMLLDNKSQMSSKSDDSGYSDKDSSDKSNNNFEIESLDDEIPF